MSLKLYLASILLFTLCFGQGVGINTPTPDPSALLDLKSDNKGFLPPRLTTNQRNSIPSPAAGLVIFNTDSQCLEYWNGQKWVSMCTTVPPCNTPPTPVASSNSPLCQGANLNLTSTPVAGASYVWSGPNGFSSTAQNPTITSAGTQHAGNYIVRAWLLGCYSEPDTVTVSISPHGQYRSCRQILQQNPTATSGVYTIDVDSLGPLCPMQCYCDMTTDGGGWTLVLNYNHLGPTKPALNARTSSFPLLGSTALGVNESGTTYWGHVAPALANKMTDVSTIRFYAITAHHARVMHFKTSLAGCVTYLKTGTGSCTGLDASYSALAGHTTGLPGNADMYGTNSGNLAMTDHLFYQYGMTHWNIDGSACGNDRWETDDCTANCGGGGCSTAQNGAFNTYHQIWFR